MSDIAIEESSIQDYIDDYRDMEISYDLLHFKELNTFESDSSSEQVILLSESILNKYRNDLEDLKVNYTIPVEKESRYFCNPWLLSYDLYGTVEFWYLILEANHMYSATELTQNRIIVYNGSLPNLVDSILALEEEFIDNNEEEIKTDKTIDSSYYENSDSDDDIEILTS